MVAHRERVQEEEREIVPNKFDRALPGFLGVLLSVIGISAAVATLSKEQMARLPGSLMEPTVPISVDSGLPPIAPIIFWLLIGLRSGHSIRNIYRRK